MDVTAYRRRWWLVALVAAVGLGVGLLVPSLEQARYRSSIRMLVSGASGRADRGPDARLAQQRAAQLASAVTIGSVVTAAARTAGSKAPSSRPDVTASASSGFLTVTVTADSAVAAQRIATAYPLVLPAQLATLGALPTIGTSLLAVADPASAPRNLHSRRPLAGALIGLAAGLLVGTGVTHRRRPRPVRASSSDVPAPAPRHALLAVGPDAQQSLPFPGPAAPDEQQSLPFPPATPGRHAAERGAHRPPRAGSRHRQPKRPK